MSEVTGTRKAPEDVYDVLAELVDERHTCRACEFRVCPSLVLFERRVRDAVRRERERRDARLSTIELALKKIMDYTEEGKGGITLAGYVNRVAMNALYDVRHSETRAAPEFAGKASASGGTGRR